MMGMKRLLAVATAMAMVFALAVTASAADDSAKITGVTGKLADGYTDAKGSDTVHLGDVHPGEETVLEINLYDTMFTWSGGTTPSTPTTLTARQIKDAKLTAKANNTRVLKSVSIDQAKGLIEVKFRTELVSTKETEFDFTVYLMVDGKRDNGSAISFTGSFVNPTVDLDENDDYVDISGGDVAKATSGIAKIEINMGEGVSAVTRLYEGNKIYGKASRNPTEEDNALMVKYPAIEEIVTLKTVGLRSNVNIIRFSKDYYKEYHVYDQDFNYLGTTKSLLPVSGKYYLANQQITVA